MRRKWNVGLFYTQQAVAANYLLPVYKVAASAAALPMQIGKYNSVDHQTVRTNDENKQILHAKIAYDRWP